MTVACYWKKIGMQFKLSNRMTDMKYNNSKFELMSSTVEDVVIKFNKSL